MIERDTRRSLSSLVMDTQGQYYIDYRKSFICCEVGPLIGTVCTQGRSRGGGGGGGGGGGFSGF